MKLLNVVIVAAALLIGSSAHAQVLEPPRRPSRPLSATSPPDPNRIQQVLTFGLDLLGGFDDNLSPEGGDSTPEFLPRSSGYSGLSVAKLAYAVGRGPKAFDTSARSYMSTYRNIGLTPIYGGEITARAGTPLGRHGRVEIRQNVRSDPFFSLNALSLLPVETGAQLLEADPSSRINESRSWTTDTAISISQRPTLRTGYQIDYGFNKREYETRQGFDNRTHVGAVTYNRSFNRSTALRAAYRHSNVRSVDYDNQPRPFQDHAVELGIRFDRDLSPTRRASFAVGSGAARVDTINALDRNRLVYWSPSGYATTEIDLARSWRIEGNYRRGVSMLQGLTPQLFVTDAANFSLGGFLSPRTDVTLTAGSSSGHAGGQNETAGRFRSDMATAQIRLAITYWSSVLFSYTRYNYELDETASLALGISREMNRNAVRLGFSLTLPLVGGR